MEIPIKQKMNRYFKNSAQSSCGQGYNSNLQDKYYDKNNSKLIYNSLDLIFSKSRLSSQKESFGNTFFNERSK